MKEREGLQPIYRPLFSNTCGCVWQRCTLGSCSFDHNLVAPVASFLDLIRTFWSKSEGQDRPSEAHAPYTSLEPSFLLFIFAPPTYCLHRLLHFFYISFFFMHFKFLLHILFLFAFIYLCIFMSFILLHGT